MMETATALRPSRLGRSDPCIERCPPAWRGRPARVQACAGDGRGAIRPGARVKVTESVKVFHVPKGPKEGTDLKGLQGDVVADARQHEGIELSANFPWKVQFQAEGAEGRKKKKFFVHMREDEFEVIG